MMKRQGDVLIVQVAKVPSDRKPLARDKGRIVLAYGEVTGHAHAITARNAALFEAAGRVYLSVDGDCVTLDHEEHSTVVIDPGDYEVIRQREYRPAGIVNVAD